MTILWYDQLEDKGRCIPLELLVFCTKNNYMFCYTQLKILVSQYVASSCVEVYALANVPLQKSDLGISEPYRSVLHWEASLKGSSTQQCLDSVSFRPLLLWWFKVIEVQCCKWLERGEALTLLHLAMIKEACCSYRCQITKWNLQMN